MIDGLRCLGSNSTHLSKKKKIRKEKRAFQALEQWEACVSTRREAGCGEPLISIKININTPAPYHFYADPGNLLVKDLALDSSVGNHFRPVLGVGEGLAEGVERISYVNKLTI